MKNSLDVIISCVVLVIALIVSGACFASKRTVVKPTDPAMPKLDAMAMPSIKPAMDNGLNLGGSKSAGGGMQGGAGGYGGMSSAQMAAMMQGGRGGGPAGR
jgi:hypothetical protein